MHIWDTFRRAPFGDFQDPDEAEPPMIELAYQALLARLKREVADYWRQLRAAEILLDEAAAAFGEEAALPEVRAIVVWLRDELTALHEKLKTEYPQGPDLLEPDERGLDLLRRIAGWPKTPTTSQTINTRL